MAGLVPATPCLLRYRKQDVDARDKRGHDDGASDEHTGRNFPGLRLAQIGANRRNTVKAATPREI
jgi:hypothetical protein